MPLMAINTFHALSFQTERTTVPIHNRQHTGPWLGMGAYSWIVEPLARSLLFSWFRLEA